MNDNYIYTVAPEDFPHLDYYISSKNFLPDKEFKALETILSETYKEDCSSSIAVIVRKACHAFNERFEGFNLKPYNFIISDTILF